MDTYLKHSRGPWNDHKYDYIDADGNYVYKYGSSGNVTKAPIINPNIRANQNPNVNRNQQATPNQNPSQAPWETNFYNEVNRRLTAHPGLFDTKNFVNADLNNFKLFVKEFGGVDYTKIPDNQLEQMRQKVAAHYAQENEVKKEESTKEKKETKEKTKDKKKTTSTNASNISNLDQKRLEEQQRRSAESDEYKKKKASGRGGGSMFNSDMPDAPYAKGENYLMHFGKPMRSGRYPYGSGKDPFQRITRKLGLRSFFVKKDKKKEEKKDNTESNTTTNTHHKTIDASENYEDFQKRLKDDIKNMTDEEIIQRINRINNENRLFELENKRSPYYKVPKRNDRSEKTEESKDNKEEPKKEYDDKLNTSKEQRIKDLKNVKTTPTKLLKEKIERLRTEKDLRQLTESEITPGRRFIKDVLKESGKKIIVTTLDGIAKEMVKKAFKDDKKKDNKDDKKKEKEDEHIKNSPGGLLGLPGPTLSGSKKGKKK